MSECVCVCVCTSMLEQVGARGQRRVLRVVRLMERLCSEAGQETDPRESLTAATTFLSPDVPAEGKTAHCNL